MGGAEHKLYPSSMATENCSFVAGSKEPRTERKMCSSVPGSVEGVSALLHLARNSELRLPGTRIACSPHLPKVPVRHVCRLRHTRQRRRQLFSVLAARRCCCPHWASHCRCIACTPCCRCSSPCRAAAGSGGGWLSSECGCASCDHIGCCLSCRSLGGRLSQEWDRGCHPFSSPRPRWTICNLILTLFACLEARVPVARDQWAWTERPRRTEFPAASP